MESRNEAVAMIHENTTNFKEEIPLESTNLSMENADVTVQVEALDEFPSPVLDEIEEEIFYDAEETLSAKQARPEEQTEEDLMVEKANAQGKMTTREADKLIDQVNREYYLTRDLIDTKAKKLQGLAAPGQGLYNLSLGLTELKKAESQKENLLQQVKQETQNQQGNTADDLKRKIDEITKFDPSQRNSSSLRG